MMYPALIGVRWPRIYSLVLRRDGITLKTIIKTMGKIFLKFTGMWPKHVTFKCIGMHNNIKPGHCQTRLEATRPFLTTEKARMLALASFDFLKIIVVLKVPIGTFTRLEDKL